MPQPMRTPEPKKAQTTFMDDDLLPDDMPASEFPQEAPTGGALTAGKTVGKGLPTSKVDTGTVAVHNPKPELVSNINPSDFIMNYQGADDDEAEGYDEPKEPEVTTLPAIIQTALSTEHGEIKSYQMDNVVRQAPGPMQAQLQKIGRDIFSQYSETPKSLKDIYAVTSMTNSETEVKLMLAWVVMHGRKISEAEYDFPSMPGYKPKAELWEDEGARFLIVRETPKDFAGESVEESFDDPDFEEKVDGHQCLWYIYGWDEPKERIGDGGLRADLLEMAKIYAKDNGKVTIREAYETVVELYLTEDFQPLPTEKKTKIKEGIEDNFDEEGLPPEAMTASDFDDIPETGLYSVPFNFDLKLDGSKEFMEGILDRPKTSFEITWKAGALVAGPIRRGFEKIKAQILYNDPQAVVNIVEDKEFGQRSFTMYASNIDPIVAQAADRVFKKWAAQIEGDDDYEED